MNCKLVSGLVFLVPLAAMAGPAQSRSQVPARAVQRIERDVRHEILMLPYYNVFDNITSEVEGYNVTLMGQVTQPVVKTDAGNAVKRIEGVQKVDNRIEVLPPSSMDDQLRLKLFRAIYGFPALERYDMPVIKPIRIIVKSGNVALEGVVDSEADKNMVTLRANGVPGIFSVTNHLRVEKP